MDISSFSPPSAPVPEMKHLAVVKPIFSPSSSPSSASSTAPSPAPSLSTATESKRSILSASTNRTVDDGEDGGDGGELLEIHNAAGDTYLMAAREDTTRQITVALIKPDAVSNKNVDEILARVTREGFEVVARRDAQLTLEEVCAVYSSAVNFAPVFPE